MCGLAGERVCFGGREKDEQGSWLVEVAADSRPPSRGYLGWIVLDGGEHDVSECRALGRSLLADVVADRAG